MDAPQQAEFEHPSRDLRRADERADRDRGGERRATRLQQARQVRRHRRADEPRRREREREQAAGALDLPASSPPASAPSPRAAAAAARRAGIMALSGMPRTRCNAAQLKHAPRQPTWLSSSADSGQPTVLANPAISVMPVMTLREPVP